MRIFVNTDRYPQFVTLRYVRDQIKKYSQLITVPIYYGKDKDAVLLNVLDAPWEKTGPEALANWQRFLSTQEAFQDAAKWVAALAVNSEEVQAILYFPGYNATSQRPLGNVDVYSRGVLVEQNNGQLIRKPIRCLRGMVQSPHFVLSLAAC